MFVRDYMSVNPVTIKREASVGEAFQLMKEHNVRRLPVMEGGSICGIVTKMDLVKTSPSPAASLSEVNQLFVFQNIKVANVMTKNVVCIPSDTILEEAAVTMQANKIASLPVLEEDKLVGMITESDLFKAFIDIFGFNYPSVRVSLKVEDRVGVLAQVAGLIKGLGINIISVVVHRLSPDSTEIILRLATKDADTVTKALQEEKFEILHVAFS